jgi:Sel1 repeat protein
MIESDTNYSFLIGSMPHLTCASVRALSDRFITDLAEADRDHLFAELKRDGNQLTTEPRLCAYTYAFGAVREARLRRAFSHLSNIFAQRDVELIDYGCGVGLGALVYHDLLLERGLPLTSVRRITLIDPTPRCLERAALHARVCFPGAELRTICKYTDELQAADTTSDAKLHTLHIFSQIADMEVPSIAHLADTICAGLRGPNYFACVAPFCERALRGTPPADLFVELMDPDEGRVTVENLAARRFVRGQQWTASLRVFAKEGSHDTPPPPPPPPTDPTPPPSPTPPAPSTDPAPSPPADPVAPTPTAVHAPPPKATVPIEKEPARQVVDTECRIDEILTSLNEPEEPEHIRQLRNAAENGDAKAQNKLGYLYDTGRELPQNDAEAVRWYRRAAAQNHAMALYNLANHYLSGRGVPQDTEEAIKWYRLAADRDVLPAMNNLGVIYASGRGVRRNEAEAIKWYRRAAERGDETAIRNLKKRGIKV